MSTVTSISILDVCKVVPHLVTSIPLLDWNRDEELVTKFIKLNSATCRTNVMLRGEKGRFISYKKATPSYLQDLVGSLNSFPTGN